MKIFDRAVERISALFASSVSLDNALRRCCFKIEKVGTIIDVGASNGHWALMAGEHFPDASFMLVEAQSAHEPELAKLKRDKKMDYLISAAGDHDGESYFDAGDLFGGIASHEPLPGKCIRVPMVKIDSLVKSRKLAPPFMLKLDTHGFEVPILEGAKESLKDAVLLVVEVYNFHVAPESLRFHEIIAYLEERGFRCVDICDPLFRKDGVLWQMDLFFMRKDAKCFDSSSYQ